MTEFVRVEHNGQARFGRREPKGTLELLDGAPWTDGQPTGEPVAEDSPLLSPAQPGKILAAAVNYRSHATKRPPPSKPELFLKPPSCLVASGENVVIPFDAGRVDAEGELVVVIGRPARRVSPDHALEYVAGFTAGFDISARMWQRADRSFWRAKGADTFGPLGPSIRTDLDFTSARLTTRVNGEVRQEAALAELIFGIPQLISFASQSMTLEPGDLIFTGTPSVTPQIQPGDEIELEIDGLSVLRNRIVAEPVPDGATEERSMDYIEERLHRMGLELPPPRPPSVANILKAVRTGNLLFVSGHGPYGKEGLLARGKVGQEISADDAYDLAKHSALGCLLAAKNELGSLDRIRRIVKLLVFINATQDFFELPKVANGASDLLNELFGEAGRHARSAMGMASVPNNMPIEIEMVMEVE